MANNLKSIVTTAKNNAAKSNSIENKSQSFEKLLAEYYNFETHARANSRLKNDPLLKRALIKYTLNTYGWADGFISTYRGSAPNGELDSISWVFGASFNIYKQHDGYPIFPNAAKMPPFLKYLIVCDCKLETLPSYLFHSDLEEIKIMDSKITKIPENLTTCTCCYELQVTGTQIEELPTLPPNVTTLIITNNAKLQTLPTLPPKLLRLTSYWNPKIKLPTQLPATIRQVQIDY